MWELVEADKHPEETKAGSGQQPGERLAARLPDFAASEMASPLTDTNKPGGSLWRFIGYGLLGLTLTMTLAGQIGYRHLDTISQHPTLRPWLLAFCQHARCVLPIRQNSESIVSTRLVIEPHTVFQDASQMTLSFTNTADFTQALPTIELAFNDTQGRTVAGRRFPPGQYQPWSAATRAPATQPIYALAAGQAVTTQLAFVDPADAAVNYRVRFFYE